MAYKGNGATDQNTALYYNTGTQQLFLLRGYHFWPGRFSVLEPSCAYFSDPGP